MKPRTLVASLAGASAVYIAMAACGGGGTPGAPGSSSGGDVVDALLDSLTNPVPDAVAAPSAVEEPCDKTYTIAGTAYAYAEHAYPGKTLADLALVRAILHAPGGLAIPGYKDVATPPALRDGAAAVACGTVDAKTYARVTFVLP